MATHIYTSIIANYITKARVLAHSVKRCHPEAVFHLFISDALPAGFDPSRVAPDGQSRALRLRQRSRTRASRGWEQQISALPSAGGSIGSGL